MAGKSARKVVTLPVKIQHDAGAEFKKIVQESIGNLLDEVEIFHSQIVVAKFIKTKHSANIIVAETSKNEERWQGKCGLVLKIGPGAFVDTPETGTYFHGVTVKVGDWIHYRSSDGADFHIRQNSVDGNKVECRVLEDVDVKGRLTRPDLIW